MSKSRNANGEGSLGRLPDGRWQARYHVLVGGAWKRRALYGKTKEEAAKKLRQALGARDDGAQPISAKETVGKYLDGWMAGIEAGGELRPRSVASYRGTIELYLKPALGKVPLARLQPQQVAQLYRDLLAAGKSAKTVRNTHGVLHRALEQALRWRLLPVNVADLVDPPRRTPHEMDAFSPEEARQVLAAAAGDDLEALWVLALTAGLRQGELLALRWADVDLERGSLRVVASMVRIAGQEPQLAEPKSKRSRRQVELSAGAVEALRRHREAQRVANLVGYVFTRADGRPLSVTTLWKRWQALLARAQVRRIRFHDARHTAATLLLSRGVHPKLVSEMLGHSTVAITLDVYSHVTPAMHREAARVMDEVLGG